MDNDASFKHVQIATVSGQEQKGQNVMTLSSSETCRRVADIIDYESERFSMHCWQDTTDCGTTACIAGHTALLHNDGVKVNRDMAAFGSNYRGEFLYLTPNTEWRDRQSRRLGLTENAGATLFNPLSGFWRMLNEVEENIRYSKVLRQLEKELADRDEGDLVNEYELEQIAKEALW